MRRQGTDQENFCKTYIQQKIYAKKSQTLNYKKTKDMNRDFTKKNIQAHKKMLNMIYSLRKSKPVTVHY